jgi:tRNA-dihydrouridine synthase C
MFVAPARPSAARAKVDGSPREACSDNPGVTANPPTLILAPMEGLLDHGLRTVLTRVAGVDRCVSEFIRVTDQLLPLRSFTRVVPELLRGSRTLSGVPVRPQLLGSDPVCLAENAARLAELRPAGIDLNFGCPAKTVNRHRGGVVLMDEPELMHAIVAAVRRAVPAVPVSAKMRLGIDDDRRALECAQALEAGGERPCTARAPRRRATGRRRTGSRLPPCGSRCACPWSPTATSGRWMTPCAAARSRAAAR